MNPPIGLFAAVMGLVGLGLAARAAASLFPGVFRAPAYFTELWIALGLLAYVALVLVYSRKAWVAWDDVKAEFQDPAKMGFVGAPCVATGLVAAALAPYFPGFAGALWWIAVVMTAIVLALGVARIARLGLATPQLHPAWIVVLMGGIVLPTGGLALGYGDMARVTFCAGAIAGLLLVVPLASRPPLPEPLRPTWFILVAPPSLLYLNGSALFGPALFEPLFYVAVAVVAGVLFQARTLHRVGFGPVWWSITFPLDAFAFAAARFARAHPEPVWRIVAGLGIVLATLAVILVLGRSMIAFARRPAHARVQ
ncbi:MAG TPA: hypothetical protein VEB41_06655 [Burkholderiales bacterium]|nr:hypothetical protein [Burkholderiales bacterium]